MNKGRVKYPPCTILTCASFGQVRSISAQVHPTFAVSPAASATPPPTGMGSVDPDYQCPWCGRIGAGGYAPDGIGYPICTNGPFSCLWFSHNARQVENMRDFRELQLRTIFFSERGSPRTRVLLIIMEQLAAFLDAPPTRWPVTRLTWGVPESSSSSSSIATLSAHE